MLVRTTLCLMSRSMISTIGSHSAYVTPSKSRALNLAQDATSDLLFAEASRMKKYDSRRFEDDPEEAESRILYAREQMQTEKARKKQQEQAMPEVQEENRWDVIGQTRKSSPQSGDKFNQTVDQASKSKV